MQSVFSLAGRREEVGRWRSISAAGGATAESLTRPPDVPGQYAHVWPEVLPGGRDVLFIAWGDASQPTSVSRFSLETRRAEILRRVRWEGGFWISSGHLLAIDDSGVVRATPFDPQDGTLTGSETPVLENVNYNIGTVKPWLSVADNGNLVYAPGNPRQRKLVWVDRSGQITSVGDDHGAYFDAALSPDGPWIAYVDRWEIWMRDEVYVEPFPRAGDPIRISTAGGSNPMWRGDGRQLYYRAGDWVMAVDIVLTGGSVRAGAAAKLFPITVTTQTRFDVTPDGGRFLTIQAEPGSEPARLEIVPNWFEELKQRMTAPKR